ncbi:hypothetical protein LEN26_014183 [Aphanomyces euteiches]|nr:hypothetical protein LEN26_014183 [Aphanomyces euteiches]
MIFILFSSGKAAGTNTVTNNSEPKFYCGSNDNSKSYASHDSSDDTELNPRKVHADPNHHTKVYSFNNSKVHADPNHNSKVYSFDNSKVHDDPNHHSKVYSFDNSKVPHHHSKVYSFDNSKVHADTNHHSKVYSFDNSKVPHHHSKVYSFDNSKVHADPNHHSKVYSFDNSKVHADTNHHSKVYSFDNSKVPHHHSKVYSFNNSKVHADPNHNSKVYSFDNSKVHANPNHHSKVHAFDDPNHHPKVHSFDNSKVHAFGDPNHHSKVHAFDDPNHNPKVHSFDNSKVHAFGDPNHHSKVHTFVDPNHHSKVHAFDDPNHHSKVHAFDDPNHHSKVHTFANSNYHSDDHAFDNSQVHAFADSIHYSKDHAFDDTKYDISHQVSSSNSVVNANHNTQSDSSGNSITVTDNNPFDTIADTKYPRPTTAPVSQTPQPTRAITTPPPLVTQAPAQTLSVFVNDLINKRTTTPAPTTTTTVENLLIIPSTPSPPPLPTQSDGLLAPITEQPQTVVPRPNSTQRNDNTPDSQGDTTATAISVSGAETSKTQTTRYIFSALVGVTLVLLVFFHYVAINPSSIAPETATEVFTSPNSWQLPTFISFVQCVSLGSFLNVNAPHAVFVAFTDSFSWMNLIVRSSPSSDLKTTTASSLVATLSQGSTANRQLAGANSTSTAIKYDAFGFEQFALRGNLHERDLFARAWLFFLIACASIVAIAIVAKLVARMLKKNSQYDSTQFTATSHDTSFAQQFSDRVVSFVVLFVTAVILPLSLVSTYELMQDINSANGFGSLSGIFALLSLIVLVSLVIGATVAVSKSSEVQLSKYDMKVTFGFLYVNLKYDRRLFCAVTLLVQLLTGVFLAVLPSSQCLLLLILHGVYLLLILGLRPFQSLFMFCMVILFEICLLVLFGIEYAMVHSDLNAIESKRALAIGVIGIVCVVVLLVFAHCIVMLWTFVMGTAFIERWKVPFSRRDGKTLELATEQELLDMVRHVPLETQREGHYLTSMQVVTVSDQERLDLARRVPLDSQRNSRSSMQVVTGNMYS